MPHRAAMPGARCRSGRPAAATSFRPYPGYNPDPWRAYSQPYFGTHKVLRGASFATPRRLHHAKFRRYARPEHDGMFCGFRSCAA